MTIKEIETLSGLPRANIRYYESEGLISPKGRRTGTGNIRRPMWASAPTECCEYSQLPIGRSSAAYGLTDNKRSTL